MKDEAWSISEVLGMFYMIYVRVSYCYVWYRVKGTYNFQFQVMRLSKVYGRGLYQGDLVTEGV